MNKCGNPILEKKFNKYKSTVKSGKLIPSSYITVKNVPYNPFCSSITGKYVFNISKIPTFKVYFWKFTDNVEKNTVIKLTLEDDNTSAVDWSSYYKTQAISALDQYTTITNSKSTIVNTYEECDIVCVLGQEFSFLGACLGPYFQYDLPSYVDNRVVLFIAGNYTNDTNIKEGGLMYNILIHEFGHGFGLAHPHDDGFGSTIMPGLATNRTVSYPGIGAYIQNNVFTTVMTYNDVEFFLPEDRNYNSNLTGYPQSLMPLDIVALKWMYNIKTVPSLYISRYSNGVINPALNQNQSYCIAGDNRVVTFGSNCKDISFYFSAPTFSYNNLSPTKIDYNRILEKTYSFYAREIGSSIATLNFGNTQISNVFIEKNSLKINLTINLTACTIFNMFIFDQKKYFTIVNNTYTNNGTKKSIKINNQSSAKINVYFNL